jgi:hypothetical protein
MGCFSAEEGEVPLEDSHSHSCAWIDVYLFGVVGDRLVGRLVLNQCALQEAFEIDVVQVYRRCDMRPSQVYLERAQELA